MNKRDILIVEKKKLEQEMADEVFLAKKPYLAKIKALDIQMKPFEKGKNNSEIAKNVRKHKAR